MDTNNNQQASQVPFATSRDELFPPSAFGSGTNKQTGEPQQFRRGHAWIELAACLMSNGASASEAVLYCMLALRAYETLDDFVSISGIATYCGESRQAAHKRFESLVTAGLVVKGEKGVRGAIRVHFYPYQETARRLQQRASSQVNTLQDGD